jgi:hypothetical protein
MRRILFAAATFVLCVISVSAQTTQVTGTVKDLNGIPYAGARMAAQLVFSGTPVSNPTVTINVLAQCKANGFGSAPCQVPFNPNQGPFFLDNSGNVPGGGVTLQDNSLVTPASTQWQFTVNSSGNPPPLGTGPQVCSATLTISGSSQSASVAFAACPALSNVTGSSGGSGSSTSIVTNGLVGDYQFLVGESPCTVLDHSSLANNATGCVGVPPTIAANTGGLVTSRNGAVQLPSVLNTVLTIQAQVVFQTGGLSQGAYDPVICAGTPATSGTGIVISTDPTSAGLFGSIGTVNNAVGSHKNDFQGNGRQFDSTVVPAYGLSDIAFVMDAVTDRIYVNGVQGVLGQSGAAAGACNSGVYQIGGAAAGSGSSVITYFSGTIVRLLFYNRELTSQELAQNHNALVPAAFARGFSLSQLSNNILPVLLAVGDSETVGSSGAITYTSTPMALLNFSNVANKGFAGFTAANMIANAAIFYQPVSSTNAQTAVVVMAGANDSPCATFTSELTALGKTLRSYGYNLFVTTVADYGGTLNDAQKNCENLFIRTQWRTFSDDMVDIAANQNIGGDSVSGNTLFWQVGNLHYTTHSYKNILTPDIQQHINRFYGNHDWTTATTYSSPAAAAVATTNATESINTMTFSFTAETFAVGQQMFCSGITPAGYNGKWYILTANTTTVTAFNGTTGLGNQTVAGTCQVPQQLDQDSNYIVNFGAGNTVPESCESWTGQNVTIKNINAGASTFAPFAGETVDVSTIAANAISIFQVKLATPSTPVCSWIKVQ